METSDAISLIAILFSILTVLYIREHDDNIRFLNMFNDIYRKTFKLRTDISNLTNKYWNLPFYYEYDSITDIDEIEEQILDYLTELENFFSFVRSNKLSQKSFYAFVSYPFYQRTAALYSYILKKRLKANNSGMFKNYVKTIRLMKNIKKIKKQIYNNKSKYYVGIRESDIAFTKKYFEKAICLFSDTPYLESFSIRLNQNINNREILPFYNNALQSLSRGNGDVAIYFYNQRTAYNYDKNILKKSKCINPKELLDFLSNKLLVKEWFVSNNLPVIPFETFMGEELLCSRLCMHFEGYNSFVIQSAHGGGGIGTFYAEQRCLSDITGRVEPLQRYIVSPYIPNVSINIHVFISDKQTVLSPASIQIIELRNHQLCYRGGDFCAFQQMSISVKEKIKKMSIKISDMLRKKGYHGIAGIDYIVDHKEDIYCCEINPRFQASTFVLDRYLQECSTDKMTAKSCFELNEMAFQGSMVTTLCFEDRINYSCYFYYSDGIPLQYFKEKCELLKKCANVDVFENGMRYYIDKELVDDNSYLFHAMFNHAIGKVSPDMTLWINDNISVYPKPNCDVSLKIALLNQGIRMEGKLPNIKTGVYESIDICIKSNDCLCKNLKINCAYGIHLSNYSPYLIKVSQNSEELYYYNEKIADIYVERDCIANLSAIDKKILFIATDRLRIKILSGCENKNAGKGCAFCNVPISDSKFSLIQIIQALEDLKINNLNFRHILIGGGSSLENDSWDMIMRVCQYLKNDVYYKNKPISIMTMLPPKNKLVALKNAGVDEVAFNLEVADDDLASQIMPAKRTQSKTVYYEILRESVQIFGVGNVRSALLVGLDRETDIYNEIVTLAEIGVIPCLSAFRALPKTKYENDLGPDNAYLLKVHNHAAKLLESMSGSIKQLGPICKECRNNMLMI